MDFLRQGSCSFAYQNRLILQAISLAPACVLQTSANWQLWHGHLHHLHLLKIWPLSCHAGLYYAADVLVVPLSEDGLSIDSRMPSSYRGRRKAGLKSKEIPLECLLKAGETLPPPTSGWALTALVTAC
jgi:hypothetical protein